MTANSPNTCISEHLFLGSFGFEKENIRVTKTGELALTPHPVSLGNKSRHPYITTDFSESQVEVITPPLPSIEEALGFLETLQDLVSVEIADKNGEYLWPQSAPPILPENDEDIPLAQFDESHAYQGTYRELLSRIYGRKRQMMSGIHFNLSFSERTIAYLHNNCNSENRDSYEEFRERIYFKTARNFLRYRWFLIALLGESPVIHKTYIGQCLDTQSDCCVGKMPTIGPDAYNPINSTSVRNTACGYRNKEEFPLDYTNLARYRESLNKLVESHVIHDVRENYSAIRVKTDGTGNRISHLEFRTVDLDPLVKCGINPLHAKITHLFAIFCLLEDERQEFCSDQQFRANYNHDQAAQSGLAMETELLDPQGKAIKIQDALNLFMEKLENSVGFILPEDYKESFQYLATIIAQPELRPATIVLAQIKEHNFIDWHLSQAEKFLQQSRDENFIFHGLRDMELSTQLLLRKAVLRGVHIEIMDRSENFVRLERDGHSEIVMQATRTSLDPYSHILAMENKVMTKKILDRAGINTPRGDQYHSIESALRDFSVWQDKAIVIKPKSTNFGLGIGIIKNNKDYDLFKRSLEIAFEYDKSVLIEDFFAGREFRFFVVNDRVEAVLLRVPANVTGDGVSTITELVAQKNLSPLRGQGYRTPLEKIKLGEIEEIFLHTQGYTFDTVPVKDQIIYLRENSNISTGGDSIDYTDAMPQSYKDMAVRATLAMGVKITGLDMMVPHIDQELNDQNYTIIEMNFNPAIHLHCHPYKGQGQPLDEKVLDALGFTA